MKLAKLKKLLYEEVAKCTRCGFCLPNCPTYQVMRTEPYTARGRNAITRALIEGRLELDKELAEAVFSCLGCGACTQACFPSIKTGEAVTADRECLVEAQLHPQVLDHLKESLNEYGNITEDEPEERGEWRELITGAPEDAFEKTEAETVFFVGCVASYFPLAQKIPGHMAQLMDKAGLDFAILGGEEWCCGFPLLGAGMPEEMTRLKEHNLAKVAELKAKRAVFSCPSCFHTWRHFYNPDIELLHASQLLDSLIQAGQLKFKPLDMKVTYHDPCDLGRNSGVYEEPRAVLKAIPGLELREMAANRALANCCGGGGNVEMVNPALAEAVARRKIDEALATGAEAIVTSCQQCLRTMTTRVRRDKVDLKVLDLTEVVRLALE